MTVPVDARRVCLLLEQETRRERERLIDLWRSLVDTDSGSHHHDGVARVGDLVRARLERLGFTVQPVRPSERYAGHLVCRRHRPDGQRGTAVIMGHLDTVWQEPVAHEWPFSIADGLAAGPGVGDMKGGLVLTWVSQRSMGAERTGGLWPPATGTAAPDGCRSG